MGSYSSGPRKIRPSLDDGLRLSLSMLVRDGAIKSNHHASGELTWRSKRDDRVTAAIGYIVQTGDADGILRLRYRTTLRGSGTVVPSDYALRLVATPQPFGGLRWWVLCPETGSRCVVLYIPPGRTRFVSQRACRGSYRSQRITDRDRAMELAQGINMAMGGNGNLFDAFPDRPPRMWQSTYERKRERAERAKGKSLAALGAWLDRTSPAWRTRAG